MTQRLVLQLAEWAGVVAVTMILALSPAFKRRPLIFKYPVREGWVALGLAVLVGIIKFALFPHVPSLNVVLAAGKELVFTPDDLTGQMVSYALFLVPLTLLLYIRRQPLLSAGLGRQTLRPSLYLGFALALITIFLQGKIYSILNGGMTIAHAFYLLAMLAGTFVEEFIFRGFVQARLTAWLGSIWGWVLTAVLFTLWSVPDKLVQWGTASPAKLALGLAAALGTGLVCGWIMNKSGNILAPWLYRAFSAWTAVL